MHLNFLQRVGLVGSIAFLLIATVLHAPWSGYTTQSQGFSALDSYASPSTLDFQLWHSNNPAFQWIGYLLNFLGVVVALGLLLGAWLFFFSKAREK